MYIHVTTSITTMKIKVKCKLRNHLLTKYCLFFNRPNVIRSQFQLAHSVGPSRAHQRWAISMAYRWQTVGGPTLCSFWAAKFPFISIKTYYLGVKKIRLVKQPNLGFGCFPSIIKLCFRHSKEMFR